MIALITIAALVLLGLSAVLVFSLSGAFNAKPTATPGVRR